LSDGPNHAISQTAELLGNDDLQHGEMVNMGQSKPASKTHQQATPSTSMIPDQPQNGAQIK